MDHRRADGVRIAHDPFAPGVAEKYGTPGKTDKEGFDPYKDTVGPGIYGGIVMRDAEGGVVVGRQYQDHSSRPGPVYAGGGYTPISAALGDATATADLLSRFPDLVNDISTGGAQPLHMCGMSREKEASTGMVIAGGGDIEALDTYGFTPLHRMASNNLAIGARALLEAGADPGNKGKIGQTPADIARMSAASDVLKLLQEWGVERREVSIARIAVEGSGYEELNGEYVGTHAEEIPTGFEWVCHQNRWDSKETWEKLNGGRVWYKATNSAFIYWNQTNGVWWMDEPSGNGVYIAQGPAWAPPQAGWKSLGPFTPLPSLVATFRNIPN